MKVDEQRETQTKVGVTFQRIPFETEIDIFPKMNPLAEGKNDRSGDAGDMSSLTSVQTEERLREAVHHRKDEEFLPIPLKRIDSGPHQHHIQELEQAAKDPTENSNVTHHALLDEIDNSTLPKTEAKVKSGKKENTLTRMLKGIRVEKSNKDESEDKLGTHISISKIFQRINPVGKASRDNFSKVFHRIGDALQKRSEGEECSVDSRDSETKPEGAKSGPGEHKCQKIGEKMFRCRPSNTDARKTTS